MEVAVGVLFSIKLIHCVIKYMLPVRIISAMKKEKRVFLPFF